MFKAIIFDIGGVLIPYLDNQIDGYIKRYLNISDAQFELAWNLYVDDFTMGKISESLFWEKVLECTKSNKTLPEESLFLVEYKKNLLINKELVSLIQNLKNKYKLAVLSNSIEPLSTYNKQIGLYDCFDLVILSEEVGMKKPSTNIYLHILSELRIAPHEAVFIDDKLENIDSANAVGMCAIKYQNNDQVINELSKFVNFG